MSLGETIDLVLKLAAHTATRLPEPHKAEAEAAIEDLREFQRGFCISHTLQQRRK